MENFSKKYAHVQMSLLNLEKAAVSYEENSKQTEQDSKALIALFSETFDAFCELLADYLHEHHKGFQFSKNPQEIIANAHKAGFLAEHDSKVLFTALKEKGATRASHEEIPAASHHIKSHIMNVSTALAEIPLIHNIETYTETMQTIMREIKP